MKQHSNHCVADPSTHTHVESRDFHNNSRIRKASPVGKFSGKLHCALVGTVNLQLGCGRCKRTMTLLSRRYQNIGTNRVTLAFTLLLSLQCSFTQCGASLTGNCGASLFLYPKNDVQVFSHQIDTNSSLLKISLHKIGYVCSLIFCQ